jgi:hypothetical protein
MLKPREDPRLTPCLVARQNRRFADTTVKPALKPSSQVNPRDTAGFIDPGMGEGRSM